MRRAILATLAAATLLTLAAPASAYVRSRSPDGKFDIIWPDPRITLILRTNGTAVVPMDDFVAAAMRAAATWSDPTLGSSVDFAVATSSDAPADPAFDHQNTISFRTSSWQGKGHTPGQLAVTTVWTQGGRIVDTDTEINAVDPSLVWALLPDDPAAAAAMRDKVDLQNALTHELGHVLGLDHPCFLGSDAPDPPEVNNDGAPVPSCSDPALPASVREATMFPSATRGSIGERTLSPDEVLALHDLYPAGQAPVVERPPAEGGCAVGGAQVAPSNGALVAAALVAPALLQARRRRSRRGRA